MKQGPEVNGGRESRPLRALVRVFPRTFREQFGDDVLRTLRAAHRAASASGARGRVAFWLRNIPGLIVGAVRERIEGSGGRQDKEAGMRSSKTGVVSWLYSFNNDLRYAGRALKRNPGFAAAAVLTRPETAGCNHRLAAHRRLDRPASLRSDSARVIGFVGNR